MPDRALALLLFCCVTASALGQLGLSHHICDSGSWSVQCVLHRDRDHPSHTPRVDHRAESIRIAEERREAEEREALRDECLRSLAPHQSTSLCPR